MKRCDRCGRTFDDTWAVCVDCSIPLSAVSGDAVADRLEQMDRRLRAVETRLGMASFVPAPRKEAPVSASSQPAARPMKRDAAAPAEPADLEQTIGLVWLNRIGAVALILGAAFFLRYAFDRGWVGPQGRVLIGLLAGFGLLFGGEKTRRGNYESMSQGLHAAGIGVLYLSIFANYAFYHLAGPLPTFAALVALTAYCGWTAVRTGWQSLAIIGMLTGFLTPFLLDVNKLGAWVCFGYLAILDLGVLYISSKKDWRGLAILAFIMTHLCFRQYVTGPAGQGADALFRAGFATIFFALFAAVAWMRRRVGGVKADAGDLGLIFMNGILYYSQLKPEMAPWSGAFEALPALLLTTLYAAFAQNARRRKPVDEELVLAYAGMGTLFSAITILEQFRYQWMIVAWSCEAVLLFAAGFHFQKPRLRLWGALLGSATVGYLVANFNPGFRALAADPFFWNDRLPAYLSAMAGSFAVAAFYRRHRTQLSENESTAGTVCTVLGNLLALIYLSQLSESFFAHLEGGARLSAARQASLSVIWVLYALGGVVYGVACRRRAIRVMALVLFGVSILKIFLVDLSYTDRVWRILSFIGLGAVLMAASFFYQHNKSKIRDFAMKD